jgi:amino acid transporter
MADRGYLPKIFGHKSKYGTPSYSILFGTVAIIMFGSANFDQLISLLNANYATALLMEYAAFAKLRLYHKDCKS